MRNVEHHAIGNCGGAAGGGPGGSGDVGGEGAVGDCGAAGGDGGGGGAIGGERGRQDEGNGMLQLDRTSLIWPLPAFDPGSPNTSHSLSALRATAVPRFPLFDPTVSQYET